MKFLRLTWKHPLVRLWLRATYSPVHGWLVEHERLGCHTTPQFHRNATTASGAVRSAFNTHCPNDAEAALDLLRYGFGVTEIKAQQFEPPVDPRFDEEAA